MQVGNRGSNPRPRQVLLDARVVVMEQKDLADLGLKWDLSAGRVSVSAESTSKTDVRISLTANRAATNSLLIALDALMENGRADLIANPKVVAMDNRRAEMRITQEEWYFLVGRTKEASDPAAETAAGTVPAITPPVGDDNNIALDIAVEVNDVVSPGQGGKPQVATRSMPKRTVVVDDDGTVVLASLMENRSRLRERQVPGIADLPLIGALFRNKSKPAKKLVVLITARQVPDPAEMAAPRV